MDRSPLSTNTPSKPQPACHRPSSKQFLSSLGLLHNLRQILLPGRGLASSSLLRTRALRLLVSSIETASGCEELLTASLALTDSLPLLHGTDSINEELVRLTDSTYAKSLAELARNRHEPVAAHAFASAIITRLLQQAAAGERRFLWHHAICHSAQRAALAEAYFGWLRSSRNNWKQGCLLAAFAIRMSPSVEGAEIMHRVAPCVPCIQVRSAWLQQASNVSRHLSHSPLFVPFGHSTAGPQHCEELKKKIFTAARSSGGQWETVLQILQNRRVDHAAAKLVKMHNGFGAKWRDSLLPLIMAGAAVDSEGGLPMGRRDGTGGCTAAWEQSLLLSPVHLLMECQRRPHEFRDRQALLSAIVRRAEKSIADTDLDQLLRAAILLCSASPEGASAKPELLAAVCRLCAEAILSVSHRQQTERSTALRSAHAQSLFTALRRSLRKFGSAGNVATSTAVESLVSALLRASNETPRYFIEAAEAASPLLDSESKSRLFGQACSALAALSPCSGKTESSSHHENSVLRDGSKNGTRSFVNRQIAVMAMWPPQTSAACRLAGTDACGEAVARFSKALLCFTLPSRGGTLCSERHHFVDEDEMKMLMDSQRTASDKLRLLRLTLSLVDASADACRPIPQPDKVRTALFLLLQHRPALDRPLQESLRRASEALLTSSVEVGRVAGECSAAELQGAVAAALLDNTPPCSRTAQAKDQRKSLAVVPAPVIPVATVVDGQPEDGSVVGRMTPVSEKDDGETLATASEGPASAVVGPPTQGHAAAHVKTLFLSASVAVAKRLDRSRRR